MARNGVRGYGAATLRADIARYWSELADVSTRMCPATLAEAAARLLDCQARGRVVFVAGNGGSAATASHFACDLAKGTRRDGPPTFRVMALTDNAALLTAWANDTSYDRVFAEQLASLAQPGDLLVAISASGNSPNVLAAVETARRIRVETIALSGRSGGRLAELADLTLRVPSDRIELVEDAHLAVAHSLCVAVREHVQTTSDALVFRAPIVAEPVDLSA